MRFVLALLLIAAPLFADSTVTLLHFSDYHSHALPFYSEGKRDQGGIARAIAYMKKEKKAGAFVFSGGDMINKGSPAWSDKFQCAEWPWLNGVVDAMAFGNHDADYGKDVFDECRKQLRYPILSANTSGLPKYEVFTTATGIRIGVFAVAGPDFPQLVRTEGLTFGDPIAAARAVVRDLRDGESVHVVVMIGHEQADADVALARAVPGIDLIFGTHSHLKQDLTKIDGTSTWFVSPFQYLTYVSRVELTFDDAKRLIGVKGGLVRVDAKMPADATVAKRIASMQAELEKDPQYTELFQPITTLEKALSVDDAAKRNTPFGSFVMEVARKVAEADVALSTSSSFRQSLPPGRITMEDLRAALPYDNEIVVYEMSGTQLRGVLEHSASRSGTDFFAQTAGVPEAIDDARTYRVATTEYLANVAEGYRELFAGLPAQKTGKRVREETRKALATRTKATLSPARCAPPPPGSQRPVC